MRATGLFVLSLVAVGALASGIARRPASAAGAARALALSQTIPLAPGSTGIATFYGTDYQGRIMANGRPFDMHDVSVAASNNWPLGTRLAVRRVEGSPWEANLTDGERDAFYGRTLVVTVQDRGAFTHQLDLSMAAFALLGRTDEGVIRVRIEPLDGPLLLFGGLVASAAR